MNIRELLDIEDYGCTCERCVLAKNKNIKICEYVEGIQAELEAAKNGYPIISLLMDMQRACPIGCRTSIYIETEARDPVVFRWDFKVKGKIYSIETRISWLDLQAIKGQVPYGLVTEKIKAAATGAEVVDEQALKEQ